jgi:hypothetical protein
MAENDIKEAFDQVRPGDEAKQRMLAGILGRSIVETNGADPSLPASRPAPARLWRVVQQVILPIAACLIFVTFVLGPVALYMGMGINGTSPSDGEHDTAPMASEEPSTPGLSQAPPASAPDDSQQPGAMPFMAVSALGGLAACAVIVLIHRKIGRRE